MTVEQQEQQTAQVDGDFAADWRAWHAAHEIARSHPHGFLAVTGLHWLGEEPERFPGAPGRWSTGPEGIAVVLDEQDEEGPDLLVDGTPVRGRHVFGHIPERGGVEARWGEAVLEVARRGGRDILRPRHPDHPLRTEYPGTPTYPPQESWVIPGRYTPFDPPVPTTVGSVAEGLEHVYEAVGRVEFTAGGEELALTVFPGGTPGALFALFADATSGRTTYPAARQLAIAAPETDGRVVLDFNRAVNLPCAYTDFATCPLPPAGNRLPVAVEAGERIPHERQGGGGAGDE